VWPSLYMSDEFNFVISATMLIMMDSVLSQNCYLLILYSGISGGFPVTGLATQLDSSLQD